MLSVRHNTAASRASVRLGACYTCGKQIEDQQTDCDVQQAAGVCVRVHECVEQCCNMFSNAQNGRTGS